MDAIIAWFQSCYNNPDHPKREFYLTGWAGTGKTTLAKEVIEILRRDFGLYRIISGAYTGKAVDVLRTKGIFNPMTIHRMMYMPVIDPETKKTRFEISPLAPASTAQLIVLDEVSMVDEKLARDLRSFKVPMLIMGDPGQLPPINGAGFTVGRTPDYFMTEIHRQAADNPILKLATMARNEEYISPGHYGDTVYVTDRYNEDTLKDYVFTKKRMPLCGMNKTRTTINRTFRKWMGVETHPLPVKGEKLICRQNSAEDGIFNGMMGKAFLDTKAISPNLCYVRFQNNSESDPVKLEAKTTTALFKRTYEEHIKEPEYKKGVHKFDYGYCLSVHSGQGSEWDHVTLIDESDVFRGDKYKWLYTGLTRARETLVIIQK